MKRFIIILFLFATLVASGANYYVSNDGNDAWDGSIGTPWETLNKVNYIWNVLTFAPGDSILLNRGDIFYGSIIPKESGTLGSSIVVGAYGTGAGPIITGLTTASGWTAYTADIDYKVIALATNPSYLLIDSVWYAMGRIPNNTYSTYESHSTTVSITDDELAASPNWTGAEAVIIPIDWIMNRYNITNHTSHTLTVSNLGDSYTFSEGYGYFIQNDYRTLDTFGEWYYDGDTLFVYSGAETIGDYHIRIPSTDSLFYDLSYDYITLTDLQFIGSGRDAVYIYSSADHVTISNCTFDFAGRDAIRIVGGYDDKYITVDSCNINHPVGCGIYDNCYDSKAYNVFTNNTIKNCGTLIGANKAGNKTMGIFSNGSGYETIQYNVIDSTGWSGIYFTGDSTTIKNNFINHACAILTDGGSIYTTGRWRGSPPDSIRGRTIEANITLNTIINNDGKNATHNRAYNIYCDQPHFDIRVKDNVSAYTYSGYFFGGALKDTITGNISFGNTEGIRWQDLTTTSAKDIVQDNQFFAQEVTDRTVWAYVVTKPWMTATGNYYAKPADVGSNHFYAYPNYTNLAGWQAFTQTDADALDSPYSLDASRFELHYNATKADSLVYLSVPKVDINGTAYRTYINLSPYTGIILFNDPNPSSGITFAKDAEGHLNLDFIIIQ